MLEHHPGYARALTIDTGDGGVGEGIGQYEPNSIHGVGTRKIAREPPRQIRAGWLTQKLSMAAVLLGRANAGMAEQEHARLGV